MTEEKNKLKEKAFEIVNKIKQTNNIFMPENAELKSKLIAELESIVAIDTQEKVKNTLNRPVLFVGDVYKSMLAGCYAHCVRKVAFRLNLLTKRLDEFSIKHFGNPVEDFEEVRQTSKDLSEIEGEFIFKDCFGQPIEKLWYGDDPAYCHASILNPNWNTYTQNTGIKNWIELYRLGKTLFLVCLEGEDSNECKEFIKNIRDMNYPEPAIPNKLIVHTNDINKLPGYFPEPFEVIMLDAGEQVKAVDTPKGNVFSCIGDMWKINLKDDHLQVKDNLYMKHIQYILEHPLKKLSLLELDKVFELKQQTNITKEQQKECMDILGSSNNLGKITKQDNENSKKHYEDKIKKLTDEIEIAKETGNKERESELQANYDEIAEILSSKEYKTRIPNQKDRNEESILKGINRCIESIKDASNKAKTGKLIAEHIDKNIERSKYHIVYSPEDSPNWNL